MALTIDADTIDSAEVRRITGASSDTIARWVKRGIFPQPLTSWPGRRRRWLRSDVEAFMSNALATTAAESAACAEASS